MFKLKVVTFAQLTSKTDPNRLFKLEAADKAGEADSRETNSALNEQKRQVGLAAR